MEVRAAEVVPGVRVFRARLEEGAEALGRGGEVAGAVGLDRFLKRVLLGRLSRGRGGQRE